MQTSSSTPSASMALRTTSRASMFACVSEKTPIRIGRPRRLTSIRLRNPERVPLLPRWARAGKAVPPPTRSSSSAFANRGRSIPCLIRLDLDGHAAEGGRQLEQSGAWVGGGVTADVIGAQPLAVAANAAQGDFGVERHGRTRAKLERGRLAHRHHPHVARVASQIVVRAGADHADEDDLSGGGHEAHETRANVVGVDAAVDHPRVDAATGEILEVHVPLDAVEIDVALDGRQALSAAQL